MDIVAVVIVGAVLVALAVAVAVAKTLVRWLVVVAVLAGAAYFVTGGDLLGRIVA